MSFAQFEREMTSDRVRDKMAASRKKGIWTGGVIPYGYKSIDSKLIPDSENVPIIVRLAQARKMNEMLSSGTCRNKQEIGDMFGMSHA